MTTATKFSAWYCLFALLGLASCGPAVSDDPDILARLPKTVDFNFHIKPVLSDRCFSCHGPDANKREADLRLDTEEGAFAALKESPGKVAITPGNLKRSEVYHRMLSDDPDIQMPPPESQLQLSEYEIALINKWIDQGAEWKPHWAFISPEKPDVPRVKQTDWVRNSIDHFVLARLEREGFAPSKAAEKERLLRRVTLDLTGLPPTLEEIDAFVADESEGAYEQVVDRLLASSAYGERMATEWLDVARYADSHGLHADGSRNMSPWRDWVIQAMNDNLPYDEFLTWQMAGDLLPNPTKDQILATAFNRNHPMTAEGGAVDEEWRLEYVFDRTSTTSYAFMGLTMECARCHDHKFDPVSQREFYEMSAFFSNIKEVGMTGDDGDFGPILLLPNDSTQAALNVLDEKITAQRKKIQLSEDEVLATKTYLSSFPKLSPGPQKDAEGHFPLDRISEKGIFDGISVAKADGSPSLETGKFGQALRVNNEYEILHIQTKNREWNEPFSTGLWIQPEKGGIFQTLLGTSGNKNQEWRGWDIFMNPDEKISFRLIHCLPHDYVEINSLESIPIKAWTHVFVSYDGSGEAAGMKLYLNGQEVKTEIAYDRLRKSIQTYDYGQKKPNKRPIRVGKSYRAFTGDNGLFQGLVDDIHLYGREISALEVAAIAGKPISLTGEEAISNSQEKLLQQHVLLTESQKIQQEKKTLRTLFQERIQLLRGVEEVMVMEELPEPRATFVLDRGMYDSPLDQVFPGVPARLGSFPDDLPKNRLGLAQWLTDPQHPLTSRVTVNRYWQVFFGQGLVNTPNDFGNQGNMPSHPALLDWLSIDFIASGWDVKALHKSIVMSATYQQDSYVSPEMQELDPQNELLARGPRHRLSAEMIRDNALAASGLLVNKIGGPSVKPYQPEGLWIELGNFSSDLLYYVPDSAEGLYRRSLYTFIRRTSPPPSMIMFDASTRNTCVIQRQNTNTPLQALVLLNDPQYVEASRILAERMQREGGSSLEGQISYAFRLLTSRFPSEAEIALLADLYQSEKAVLSESPQRVSELLGVGERTADPNLPKLETAALAMVASTILNFDESYTKR